MNSSPESEGGASRRPMSSIGCGDEGPGLGSSQGVHGDSATLTDLAPTSGPPEEAAGEAGPWSATS